MKKHMKPKGNLIEIARKDGSIDRLNTLISAAHILNCTANQYIEEAADLMNSHGLMLGRLKQMHGNFIRSADQYFKEFANMVFSEETKMDMFSDMDSFDSVFRQWSRIEKEWQPQPITVETNEN